MINICAKIIHFTTKSKGVLGIFNRASHGCDDKSKFFAWAKGCGLVIPRVESDDLIEEVRANAERRLRQVEVMQAAMSMYAATSARGTRVFDELVLLDMDIVKRRQALRDEGVDPLTDESLQKALDRKIVIMKFLERLKFLRGVLIRCLWLMLKWLSWKGRVRLKREKGELFSF